MESTTRQQYFVPNTDKQTLLLIEKNEDDQFELELLEKIQQTHDTYKFVFKLPEEDQVMGLLVGGHLFFHIDVDGQVVSRKYTPTSEVNERGKVQFVIKAYHPNDDYPKGGVMSVYLTQMKVGDKIKMEGPKGLLFYNGEGNFTLRKKPIKKTKVGLIAGGTGITPCFQLIQASSLAKDGLDLTLIYSNKTKNDILLKEELDAFSEMNRDNLKIYHTLTRHNQDKDGSWEGLNDRITADLFKQCRLPEPSEDTLIGYCGPAAFNKTVEEILTSLGYTKDMIYKF